MTPSATSLMHRHIETFGQDMQSWLDLFAEDAVLEFPYLVSLGRAGRIEGRRAIGDAIRPFIERFTVFRLQNARVFEAADPRMVFAEYEVDAPLKASGGRYRQLYSARMEVKDGKIALLREYLDTITAARALLPNGLADLTDDGGRST